MKMNTCQSHRLFDEEENSGPNFYNIVICSQKSDLKFKVHRIGKSKAIHITSKKMLFKSTKERALNHSEKILNMPGYTKLSFYIGLRTDVLKSEKGFQLFVNFTWQI